MKKKEILMLIIDCIMYGLAGAKVGEWIVEYIIK